MVVASSPAFALEAAESPVPQRRGSQREHKGKLVRPLSGSSLRPSSPRSPRSGGRAGCETPFVTRRYRRVHPNGRIGPNRRVDGRRGETRFHRSAQERAQNRGPTPRIAPWVSRRGRGKVILPGLGNPVLRKDGSPVTAWNDRRAVPTPGGGFGIRRRVAAEARWAKEAAGDRVIGKATNPGSRLPSSATASTSDMSTRSRYRDDGFGPPAWLPRDRSHEHWVERRSWGCGRRRGRGRSSGLG